jgi:hypothetical protein
VEENKMKKTKLLLTIGCWLLAVGLHATSITSPNGNIVVNFYVDNNGRPTYEMTYKGKAVIKPSHLGLELAKDKHASKGMNETDLMDGFRITDEQTSTLRRDVAARMGRD